MITVPERLPDHIEMLRKLLDGFSSSLRVAAPGIIQSFDAAKQTVTVKVAIREKVLNPVTRIAEDVEIPILVDVPIFMPRAGGFVLSLPVNTGDECLVIFSDNCFDAWYQSGGIQNQIDKRRHDLSDGFALLGIWSQPKIITSYSTSNAELRNENGTVKVKITNSEIDLIAPTVKINGVPYLTHTHTGVTTGGGITGGVTP